MFNLILSKFKYNEDFALFKELAFNESVMNMNYGRIFTLEEAERCFRMLTEHNDESPFLGTFKVLNSQNIFIGLACLDLNDTPAEAEIEYMLLPEYWNKGYGTSLVKTLLTNAAKVPSLNIVTAVTDKGNRASKRILIKNGFKISPQCSDDRNLLTDTLIYKLKESEEIFMKANGEREFELLKKIGFIRTSGSDEELKAAHILIDEVESIGCKAELEPFKVPTSKITKVSLKVTEPYEKEYDVTPYNCSVSTPEGGMECEFKYIEDGLDANLVDAKGKIVLLNKRPNPKLYKKLMEAGIAGYITMSGTARDNADDTDISVGRMREKNTQYGNVPSFFIRMSDGFEMVKNNATKMHVELVTEDIEVTSHNVVATIEGTKYPNEIISFGAHYDSVPFSTGVYDNGAGSVIIMEILRHFKENPPLRTVKFMWYGSEEVGLFGSQAYLRDHKDELKNHLLMINADVGGSVLGTEKALVTAEESVVNYIDNMAKIKGLPLDVKQDIYSSDSTAFADHGIPSMTFCRFAPEGGAFIHCRHDLIQYLSPEALEKTASIALYFSDLIVNSSVFPFEKKIPDNMKKKLNEYFGHEDKDK